MVEPDPAVRDGLQFATTLRYELSLVHVALRAEYECAA